MKDTYLVVIALFAVLAFEGLVLFASQAITSQALVTGYNEKQSSASFDATSPLSHEVRFTTRGFVPASLTVKQGTTVTFINDTKESMWVGSDEHPSHTGYAGTSKKEHCPDTPGTAFDQCSVGDSYTFTFNKIGTWSYHNHMNAGFKGSVTVTP